MRCGFCHSGNVKSAEQYGVNRQQCGSCNTITKQAELKLTETQQKMINYLSNWKSERIKDSRDVTQDLDQDGVARAIGISRSNIVRVVSPLLDSNLVGQKKAHILDENNRTIGKMKKWVYYLTPAGKALVTESFNSAHGAETFEATRGEMRQRRRTPFYELPYEEESEDKDVNKFARTNAGGALWQATYYALLDEGRSHEQAETFCNTKFFDHFYEYFIEGLRQPMRNLFDNLRNPRLGLTRKQRRENRIANKMFERYFPYMDSEEYESHEVGHFMAEEPFICPECRRASTKSKISQVCVRCESEYQAGRNAPMRVPWPGDEGYYAESFKAKSAKSSISSIGLEYPWVYAEPDVDGYLLGFECGDYWSTGTLFGGLTGNLSFINQTGQDHLSKCQTCTRSAQKSAENTLRSPTPLSPTRPSSDWPKPDGRPRRPRRRKEPKPGPEEPSF